MLCCCGFSDGFLKKKRGRLERGSAEANSSEALLDPKREVYEKKALHALVQR